MGSLELCQNTMVYGVLWLHLHDWNCTRNPTTATTSDCISKGRDFNEQLGHLSRSQVFHMSNFDECLMFVGNAHLCSISQVSSHLQFLGQFPISHHINYHIHSHPHDHSKSHQKPIITIFDHSKFHQHRIPSFITNYHHDKHLTNILPNTTHSAAIFWPPAAPLVVAAAAAPETAPQRSGPRWHDLIQLGHGWWPWNLEIWDLWIIYGPTHAIHGIYILDIL